MLRPHAGTSTELLQLYEKKGANRGGRRSGPIEVREYPFKGYGKKQRRDIMQRT